MIIICGLSDHKITPNTLNIEPLTDSSAALGNKQNI